MPIPISADAEVRRWLYGRLTTDPILSLSLGARWYQIPAPYDIPDPFGAFGRVGGGTDLRIQGVGPNVVWTELTYNVVVASRATSTAALEPLDARITAILNGAQGTTANAAIFECVRMRPATLMPEVFDRRSGLLYAQLGGEFRIRVQGK